jgi:hypothetical protein
MDIRGVSARPGGLYWLVPATLLCIVRAILDSWVLLVEINRQAEVTPRILKQNRALPSS